MTHRSVDELDEARTMTFVCHAGSPYVRYLVVMMVGEIAEVSHSEATEAG
jgi:hypothetical protein